MRMPPWKSKEAPYQVGKDGFTPKDVVTDNDGWVKEAFARPLLYDLVLTKGGGKVVSGWWNGIKWEGLRLKRGDKVQEWKQKEDGEII